MRVKDENSELTVALVDMADDRYTASITHTQKLLTHSMTHITDSQHKSESGRFPIKTQVKLLLQAYLSCINVKKKLIQAFDITDLHDR